ncbi:MAG: hypothetical protein LUF89_00760 [Ruminococcus sp.]|nr:hypothetical protein [Ruminococcus sp.]
MMKRLLFRKCIACITTLSLSLITPWNMISNCVSAESESTYLIRIDPSQAVVSEEEVAQGDVTIPAAVYLTGSMENTFGSIKLMYQSDSSHVYFENMVVGDNSSKQDTETTYESSQGTFSTSYIPYCFGYLVGTRYNTGSPMFTTNAECCDPIFGSTLYSAGNGQVTFTISYYQGIDTDGDGILERDTDTGKITEDVICDVVENEDGSGSYTYTYYDQSSFLEMEATGTIPRYDETLEAGSTVPGACNSLVWLPVNQLANGASFFGDTSDEFPFFYVDIVVEQGTPAGIYQVTFDEEGCQLISESQVNYDFTTQGVTIVVGDPSSVDVTVTSMESDATAYYTSDDTDEITASDFASEILATVTITDSGGLTITQENVDIRSLVDCNGLTPQTMYNSLKQNGCAIGDISLYYNGNSLTWEDGSLVTQKIMVGMRGDVNYDGNVTIQDAYQVQCYTAEIATGNIAFLYQGTSTDEDMETLTYFLADIDTCSKTGSDGGTLNIQDAYYIMRYYAETSAGNSPIWDSVQQ